MCCLYVRRKPKKFYSKGVEFAVALLVFKKKIITPFPCDFFFYRPTRGRPTMVTTKVTSDKQEASLPERSKITCIMQF